jgi:hypothetical protein
MRSFLWIGSDDAREGQCLVAWRRVQRPYSLGGLGILDPKLMAIALRLRWLWLHQTDPVWPWAPIPFKEDPQTFAFFKASVSIVVGDGNSTLF